MKLLCQKIHEQLHKKNIDKSFLPLYKSFVHFKNPKTETYRTDFTLKDDSDQGLSPRKAFNKYRLERSIEDNYSDSKYPNFKQWFENYHLLGLLAEIDLGPGDTLKSHKFLRRDYVLGSVDSSQEKAEGRQYLYFFTPATHNLIFFLDKHYYVPLCNLSKNDDDLLKIHEIFEILYSKMVFYYYQFMEIQAVSEGMDLKNVNVKFRLEWNPEEYPVTQRFLGYFAHLGYQFKDMKKSTRKAINQFIGTAKSMEQAIQEQDFSKLVTINKD